MAYYYVKHTGTIAATSDAGRATTARTGSWNADTGTFYGSIQDLFTYASTQPTSGDRIRCSSSHAKTYAAPITIVVPDGVIIESVDDSNQEQYLRGAAETVSAGSSAGISFTGTTNTGDHFAISGLNITGTNGTSIAASYGTTAIVNDCYFAVTRVATSGKMTFATGDGGLVFVKDCRLNYSYSGQSFNHAGGGKLILDNIWSTGTQLTTFMAAGGGGNGGTTLEIRNSDLTGFMTASTSNLFNAVAVGSDYVDITLDRCKLPSTYTLWNTSPACAAYQLKMSSCGNADEYYDDYYENFLGTFDIDTTTYLSTTYDGTNEYSYQLGSTGDADPLCPFKYRIGTLSDQDLTTAQTITVEITSDASLTDNDLWLEIVINDATDEAQGTTQSSQNSDPLAAGSALTTSTESWTSPDTAKYKIAHDLGAQASVDNAVVEVYACVGKASIFANFDAPSIAAT